jgi:dienelactone hydrolase
MMKPIHAFLAATIFLAMFDASAQQPKERLNAEDGGKIYFMSANRATGVEQLYKHKVKYDEMIKGELVIPDSQAPIPAMVIMHGSGGVDGGTSRMWGSFFNRMGIATFIIDSFTHRGISGTVSDQAQISYTTSGIDGLRALRLLATHPKIDPKRIGQIGFSRGGVATQQASWERFRASVIDGDLKFALHFPLYGGCIQYGTTTGVPIVYFFGEDDETVNVSQCKHTVALSNERGSNIKLVTFPGAHHGYDRENQKRTYIADLQTWKKCGYTTDMDNLSTDLTDKKNVSISELVVYRKTCMTRGANYGGDYSATVKTKQEVKEIVTKVFGLTTS